MSERPSLDEILAQARAGFAAGHNCAQSVLRALQTYYDLPGDDLWLAATGFGSGMGRRQIVCGAVSGAIMACGLLTARQHGPGGPGRPDQPAIREETYARVRELLGRFEAELGTASCRSLLGCDLLTPEGQAYFGENDLLERVCHRAVALAVASAVEVCGG